ncbi:MAG: hypothetical protein M2R46_00315 [Verrucomicrobia subdivision 3 bacterium]|nr:hypothetical protein [Limisphaerales bacterium]
MKVLRSVRNPEPPRAGAVGKRAAGKTGRRRRGASPWQRFKDSSFEHTTPGAAGCTDEAAAYAGFAHEGDQSLRICVRHDAPERRGILLAHAETGI